MEVKSPILSINYAFDFKKIVLQKLHDPEICAEFMERLYHTISIQFEITSFQQTTEYVEIKTKKIEEMDTSQAATTINELTAAVLLSMFGEEFKSICRDNIDHNMYLHYIKKTCTTLNLCTIDEFIFQILFYI